MDPFSALALTAVVSAAALYAVYWVVRRGVADGIRDARHTSAAERTGDEHAGRLHE